MMAIAESLRVQGCYYLVIEDRIVTSAKAVGSVRYVQALGTDGQCSMNAKGKRLR